MHKTICRCAGLFVLLLAWAAAACGADYRFEVSFSKEIRKEPYSGRVYLFFSRKPNFEPRNGPDWFHPEPLAAVDIENWKPNEPLVLSPDLKEWMLASPKPLAELDLSGCRVQAVARFNGYERVVGRGPGNGYSPVGEVAIVEDRAMARLTIDKLEPAHPFPETKWCRLLEMNSGRLSAFYCAPFKARGSVSLPASYYDQPERRYPVIFSVPGFGGTHEYGVRRDPVSEQNAEGVEFIRVTLDPSCALGHHVFADSANNGPVGEALVTEFIPELDRQYRTIAAPTARFLTGHSSGGWSTLWLQVTYPETFGGTWSTAPDPVDFHDFQRIDLYRPGENMYRDSAGERRPLARMGGQVALWYDDFDRTEEVLGFGGQLHSFEAVFGLRGPTGRPVRLWNRKTGEIDAAVAEEWKKYDIRLILESRWAELGPKLAGKLHVFMGTEDTFYLEGATRRLKESLAALGSDAVIEMVLEKNHFNLLNGELAARMRKEMVEAFLKHHKVK